MSRSRHIGVNTWVWTSPLTDANAAAMLHHVATLGFDAVELPLENPGDLSVAALAPVLGETGLRPCVVGAMAPGRDLVRSDPSRIRDTQDYLRACVELASGVGATAVCGPFYAATGRVWPMSEAERQAAYAELREHLQPVVEYAASAGVRIGIEPLNRYETSLINTVQQGLDALDELLRTPEGRYLGLALDTYHLGIEERSSAGAIRRAGEHLVHLQVCGNDRGAPGGDQTDWSALGAALDDVGYEGPLVIESFTGENASIAVAASIWRPLAETQDDLARDGLRFLRQLTSGSDS